MAVTKPILPPKRGYVERVDAEGNHYYAPTSETIVKLAEQEQRSSMQDDTDALMVDHEYRLTLLELGVTE